MQIDLHAKMHIHTLSLSIFISWLLACMRACMHMSARAHIHMPFSDHRALMLNRDEPSSPTRTPRNFHPDVPQNVRAVSSRTDKAHAGKGLGDREAGEGQEGSLDWLKRPTNERPNALDFSYLWKADDDGVFFVMIFVACCVEVFLWLGVWAVAHAFCVYGRTCRPAARQDLHMPARTHAHTFILTRSHTHTHIHTQTRAQVFKAGRQQSRAVEQD